MKDELATPTRLIVDQAFEGGVGDLSSKNPMVLSCGGIYVPHNRRRSFERPLWHILNLADEKRPVKVVSGNLLKSALAEILAKEGMN